MSLATLLLRVLPRSSTLSAYSEYMLIKRRKKS